MTVKAAEYNGQSGWYDESSKEFFPADQWKGASYQGKDGIFNQKTNEFVEVAQTEKKPEEPKKPDEPSDKSIGQRVLNTVKNIPSDIGEVVSNIGTAVAHPVNTANSLYNFSIGGIGAGLRKVGLIPDSIPVDPRETAVTTSLDSVFGSPSRLADYIEQHPVQTALNVSAATGLAGKGAEISGLPRVASVLEKGSELTNPVSLASRPIAKVGNVIADSNIPESTYGRAMKIPPGSVNAATREQITSNLTRTEKLPLGRKSADAMNKRIAELDEGVSNALSDATTQGGKVDVNKVIDGLEALKKDYANRPNPQKYYDIIDAVKDEYLNHSFAKNGELTLTDAHNLKKGTYQEIQSYYKKKQMPETGRVGIQNDVEARSKAEAAKILRDEVLSNPLTPDSVKASLSKEAGLMQARKWVERATNREGNISPFTLSSLFFGELVKGGVPAAVAWRVVGSQPIQSRIAIWLAKTKTPTSGVSSNAAFQAGQISNIPGVNSIGGIQ